MNKLFTNRSAETVDGPKQHHDVAGFECPNCGHVAVFECPNCGYLIAKESPDRLADRNTWWHGIIM
jgi:predicted RNA-binding Zn-ribbon protein involved in translation (DUF1610 family)